MLAKNRWVDRVWEVFEGAFGTRLVQLLLGAGLAPRRGSQLGLVKAAPADLPSSWVPHPSSALRSWGKTLFSYRWSCSFGLLALVLPSGCDQEHWLRFCDSPSGSWRLLLDPSSALLFTTADKTKTFNFSVVHRNSHLTGHLKEKSRTKHLSRLNFLPFLQTEPVWHEFIRGFCMKSRFLQRQGIGDIRINDFSELSAYGQYISIID